nr:hypothetical protein Csa_5G161030 [Ipomoea trifida]
MALLPLPPPPLSCASPLPENVQIVVPLPEFKLHPLLQPPVSYAPPVVGPRQKNLITSFPSATHRARSSPPPQLALLFTASLYSSNLVTVRGRFWTLNSTSIRPEKAFGDQLVWKIISTTFREGWPSGSSVSAGKYDSDIRRRFRRFQLFRSSLLSRLHHVFEAPDAIFAAPGVPQQAILVVVRDDVVQHFRLAL